MCSSDSMVRVAFPLNFSDRNWMGGVNYFRNLFEALRMSPCTSISPVVVAGPGADLGILKQFNAPEINTFSWAGNVGWRWKIRRLMSLGLGRDMLMEHMLASRDIAMVSHMGFLGKRARIPSLVWIPDFQQNYLPEFFSLGEIQARNRENLRIVRHSTAILLSSEHAREGLANISGDAADRAFVLPFVVSVPPISACTPLETLAKKYEVKGRYLFLPNQFWAHKNHEVVIRALGWLKERGISVNVISTGNLYDYRQPGHGDRLMRLVSELQVESVFRCLGLVPYPDLMGLMANAVAVLNPSLFEGWSTTVEEGKSLGKALILSDIPVHREQNPLRCTYFNARNAEELAELMLECVRLFDEDREAAFMQQAELELPARRQGFAQKYEQIVSAVLEAA